MDSGHDFREVSSSRIREWSRSWGIGNDSRVSAIQYHEWALLRGAVDAIVVRKLSEREPVSPICLSVIDKDLEVLLNLLVHLFGLSVGLWVEGRGGIRCNVEHPVKFLHELGDELWATVGYDNLGHSVLGVYMISKDSGPAFG